MIASYVPPTDIVAEFKVQTATFDAQFGQTQGGVTNISIKSGTNAFHGTAGYSFQRPSMWANDFFNNKAGSAGARLSASTAGGGSFGGPVRIPKVYDGKNKTFFLLGYEGIHDSRPRHDDATNTDPDPGDAQRRLLAVADQRRLQLPDLQSGHARRAAGGRYQRAAVLRQHHSAKA